jgi:hypothetical protein
VSAVADFFDSFAAAFSHLVFWAFLLGVLAALLRTAVRAEAWRNLLAASFPDSKVRWLDTYGAYLVKNGAGVVLPMHGDDAVRVALMRDRVEGASPAAVAATAGVETGFDLLMTVALVGVSAWLGASVVDWQAIAAHPLEPAIILVVILAAIVAAVVGIRRKAKGLGEELKQGVAIFKNHGAYARRVLPWQLAGFALELATLYFLLIAFGFASPALTSVVLIRTAQRVTVSLPGFLESGSQQAMIVAILRPGHTAGQALGFGVGSKITLTGLDIGLALVAARIMVGPLHLRARIAEKLNRDRRGAVDESGFPQLVSDGADVAGAAGGPSSLR